MKTNKTTTSVAEVMHPIAPDGPRYFYEVWVQGDKCDTEYFPATAQGFFQALRYADDLFDIMKSVEVFVHRWDYKAASFDSVRSDEGFAWVEFDDEGDPSEIDTDLVDDDGQFLNRVPKSIINAYKKARVAYIGR